MNKNAINSFLLDNYAPLNKVSYFENITTINGEIPKELKNNTQTIREFGQGSMVSESVFVPRKRISAEGEGATLTVVYVSERDGSDLYLY